MEGRLSSPPFLYPHQLDVEPVHFLCEPLSLMNITFSFLSGSTMQQHTIYKLFTALLFSSALLLAGCSDDNPEEQSSEVTTEKAVEPGVIARVGDEIINFGQLNTMLNSSAMVGLSIPALGTAERSQVMITLLDKVISANLVYLDAKEKGTDRLTSYTGDVDRFEDAIIASLYKSKVMIGDTQVSDAEVLHYYNTQTSKETDLSDDVKLAIESMIRKKKLDELKATLRERLRENVDVVINESVLSSDHDDMRSDADVIASYNNHRISWSQVKELMRGADQRASLAAFYIDNDEERRTRLEQYLDNAIMTLKGRAAGLDKDPTFIKRTSEYRKTRLINEHRNGLIHSWNPSEDELKTYYVDNMDKLAVPEARKVQMVVVKTKEEAESIKAQIDRGEITMYQAAQQYSIDPNAKQTLGEMGWVSQGTGFEGLDEFTFNLEPEVVSSPVESPAGWHLVKVLDVVDAQFENLDDPQTRERTFRAYMKDKFNDYAVDLRKNHFEVVVYDDELQRQFQNEADFIAELNKKAQQEGSVTEQRVEELQKWITTPPTQ
jgi:hypothetical protein